MIKADLHMHTCYSHGKNTAEEMYAAAQSRGLAIIGFTEHSPRPAGYDYSHEYREKLNRHFQDYVVEVCALREKHRAAAAACQVIFGLEMDWLPQEEDFVRAACAAQPYEYLLGSVHFLDNWGFDDRPEPWQEAPQETCDQWYRQYFKNWLSMIRSGLFQIAAHPDLIKIFSIEKFRTWLAKPESREQIRKCLLELKRSGMAMEISSAGLRKACREIYPCDFILEEAASMQIPVSMASDAHNTEDIGANFRELEKYARSFGYSGQAIFRNGQMEILPF